MVIPIVVDTLRTIPRILVKELKNFEIKRTNRDHPGITNTGQNTEKIRGDLLSLTTVENHLLTLVRNILKGVK